MAELCRAETKKIEFIFIYRPHECSCSIRLFKICLASHPKEYFYPLAAMKSYYHSSEGVFSWYPMGIGEEHCV